MHDSTLQSYVTSHGLTIQVEPWQARVFCTVVAEQQDIEGLSRLVGRYLVRRGQPWSGCSGSFSRCLPLHRTNRDFVTHLHSPSAASPSTCSVQVHWFNRGSSGCGHGRLTLHGKLDKELKGTEEHGLLICNEKLQLSVATLSSSWKQQKCTGKTVEEEC